MIFTVTPLHSDQTTLSEVTTHLRARGQILC